MLENQQYVWKIKTKLYLINCYHSFIHQIITLPISDCNNRTYVIYLIFPESNFFDDLRFTAYYVHLQRCSRNTRWLIFCSTSPCNKLSIIIYLLPVNDHCLLVQFSMYIYICFYDCYTSFLYLPFSRGGVQQHCHRTVT